MLYLAEQLLIRLSRCTDIMKTIARQIEKRGEIKGIELGIKNRNLAIARNMLMKGYDIKSIQEITELAKEMIENLKKGK